MTDVFDPATRSRVMAAIRRRDTGPELRLRRALHAMGLRYRLDVAALPGRPDLVFPRFRAAVFVHGCFWHRHPGCPKATTPAANLGFWTAKFARNTARDAAAQAALAALGWRIAVVWTCTLGPRQAPETAAETARWLQGAAARLELPPPAPQAPDPGA